MILAIIGAGADWGRGAAIGAGSLLAQKIMQDPFEQMFSQQYLVSGSWSDPQVDRKVSAATTSGPAENVR